mmetsp:Transcript_43405/g.67983  ORF Transcript_43405/g.67983 Transcript_43405/m.67983 type:complete len:91 (-) Transcript_43405:915-1187(-)
MSIEEEMRRVDSLLALGDARVLGDCFRVATTAAGGEEEPAWARSALDLGTMDDMPDSTGLVISIRRSTPSASKGSDKCSFLLEETLLSKT